jgi:hypothetical protein
MKTILAIVVGYIAWTVLWLAGNAALVAAGIASRAHDVQIDSPRLLILMLGLSFVASLASGWVARVIAPAGKAPLILALALLATGVAVQAGVWSLMPLWYHLLFLGLLVPLCLLGSRIRFKKLGAVVVATTP